MLFPPLLWALELAGALGASWWDLIGDLSWHFSFCQWHVFCAISLAWQVFCYFRQSLVTIRSWAWGKQKTVCHNKSCSSWQILHCHDRVGGGKADNRSHNNLASHNMSTARHDKPSIVMTELVVVRQTTDVMTIMQVTVCALCWTKATSNANREAVATLNGGFLKVFQARKGNFYWMFVSGFFGDFIQSLISRPIPRWNLNKLEAIDIRQKIDPY